MADNIGHWLEKLNLGEYGKVFLENQVDLETVSDLTEADLTELDIPMGPRKKILRAIGENFAEPVLDPDRRANIHVALAHARDLQKFHAELRMKHFNFFIIVSAALVAAAQGYANSLLLISSVGIFITVFSFLLDKRYLSLIDHARAELYRLELRASSGLHNADQQIGEWSRIRAVFTTTFAYRFLHFLSISFWISQFLGWIPVFSSNSAQ